MKLEEKIYTSSELAKWFNLKPKSFLNSRKEKLKELSRFADWEQIGKGKYLIKEVYVEEYQKNYNQIYAAISSVLLDYLQKIDTCINVGTKINKEVFNNKYTDKYIAALVGQVMKNEPEKYKFKKTVGFKKGENGYATFRLFSQEEEDIYNQIIRDYINEIAEDKKTIMVQAIKDKEAGRISAAEFSSLDFNLSSGFNFLEFRQRVKEAFNFSDEEYANRLRKFEEEQECQIFIF